MKRVKKILESKFFAIFIFVVLSLGIVFAGNVIVKNGDTYFDGKVGIGKTNPSGMLDIKASAGNVYYLRLTADNGNDEGGILEDSSGNTELYLNNLAGTNTIKLDTNGNSFLNGGNVGIGTSSSLTEKLEINGNTKLTTYGYHAIPIGNTLGYLWGNHDYNGALGTAFQDDVVISTNWQGVTGNTDTFQSTATFLGNDAISLGRNGIRFWTVNNNPAGTVPVQRMTITNAGNVNIAGLTASSDVQTDASKNLISTSDERLKEIVGYSDYGLNEVMQIKPIVFRFKSDPKDSKPAIGFSAQNIKSLIPEAVNENSDGYLGLNSKGIIAALVKAIQEQQSQIDFLSSELCKKDNSYAFCNQ